MSWHLGPLAPFDVESSGTDVENDRIVSATVARIQPGEPTAVSSHLIAVDIDIPEAATEVHGISTEHARANGRPAVEVLEAVAADLADAMRNGFAVVGCNLVYDFSILDRELRRNSLPTLEARLGRPISPVLDVLVLDKAVDRYRPGGRKLVDLCAHYDVRIDGAHDAEFDALAAARVAYRIGQRSQWSTERLVDAYRDRRYPSKIADSFQFVGGMTLNELHQAQIGWYAGQAEGLAAYWRKQAAELEHLAGLATDDAERETRLADAENLRLRAESVTTDWPLRPLSVPAAVQAEAAA